MASAYAAPTGPQLDRFWTVDANTNFVWDSLAFDITTGWHIIEAAAYSGPNGTGDAGRVSIVTF